MSRFVVFDYNAYKRLDRRRFERMREREIALGHRALALTAVGQELLARVRDGDDEVRGRNRAAIKKLAAHCRGERNGQTILNFLTHTDGQLHRLYTGQVDPRDAGVMENMGAMIGAIVDGVHDDPLLDHADYLAMVETNVANVEAGFVRQLEQIAKQQAQPEPNKMRRNFDYAARRIEISEHLYGKSYGAPQDKVARIIEVAKLTSLGFALSDHVAETVRTKRGGFGQHANTVWDVEVISATSIDATIEGRQIVVVTCEEMLLQVAADENAGDRVMSIESYESLIGA
jgi:hypothetical protein